MSRGRRHRRRNRPNVDHCAPLGPIIPPGWSIDDLDDDDAFAEGQRLALESMDLPDGAYLALADEMGIDPL